MSVKIIDNFANVKEQLEIINYINNINLDNYNKLLDDIKSFKNNEIKHNKLLFNDLLKNN